MLVSYKDKYGPLGKIAVLAGRQIGQNSGPRFLGDELPCFFAPDRVSVLAGAVFAI